MGISVAASVRVGNALGAGNTEQAKLSSKVSFICACRDQIRSLTNHHVPKQKAMAAMWSSPWILDQSHVPCLSI